MSGKLIITDVEINNKKKIFSGIYNNGFCRVNFCDSSENDNVGNIYVGRVRDIVQNINAAFIEYAPGKVGYFSIADNKSPIYLNKKNTDKICQGDLLIVQIEKAAVKTKALVLTSNISLTGRYIVLNVNKNGIGFSNKIKNKNLKEAYCELLSKTEFNVKSDENMYSFGIIIRTNAINACNEDIMNELQILRNRVTSIIEVSMSRTCYSVLYHADMPYLKLLKGSLINEISEVITDNEDIYNNISKYLQETSSSIKLSMYQDNMLSLEKLYSIGTLIKNICCKNVWLKSGAFLVIEPTEAMVVIDVNTGKFIKGKNQNETTLKVNIEAAKEICNQLILRNLSGIIMIDFINMDCQEDKETLLQIINEYLLKDRVKTTLVEMTKLDIVEITRKKIEPPIYEQIL